ncbi:MAG: hypothetical protein N3G21_02440 [Candidatus Hydrogenedentes bacterium]|nr:hypothetical protein [Candidatus Hydrogenedentota bacterium]
MECMYKKTTKSVLQTTIPILFLFIAQLPAFTWQHHPLFTKLLLQEIPEVVNSEPVNPEELDAFLISEEEALASKLVEIETWARANLKNYSPCPENLMFSATGDANTIKERFFHAIRINPYTLLPLYKLGFSDSPPDNAELLDVHEVCILSNTKEFEIFCFVKLNEDNAVSPLDILISSSNEPDYGMDTNLFEDNNSEFGKIYGFGSQPFGNPNLDYGSQAPFHMGFFHESPIIYLFAPFLKKSYVEYRVYLFKELAKFAFSTGHPYWGWRFTGLGLHYLADMSMPYHSTALPGKSVLYMLIINLLDILGYPTLKNNAVQLSSNRHLAIESFMGSLFLDLVKNGSDPYGIIETFLQGREKYSSINSSSEYDKYNRDKFFWLLFMEPCPLMEGEYPPYSDYLISGCLSRRSHDWSRILDKLISQTIPSKYVNDPQVELGNLDERFDLVNQTILYGNADKIQEMVDVACASLFLFNYYSRGYLTEILKCKS